MASNNRMYLSAQLFVSGMKQGEGGWMEGAINSVSMVIRFHLRGHGISWSLLTHSRRKKKWTGWRGATPEARGWVDMWVRRVILPSCNQIAIGCFYVYDGMDSGFVTKG